MMDCTPFIKYTCFDEEIIALKYVYFLTKIYKKIINYIDI